MKNNKVDWKGFLFMKEFLDSQIHYLPPWSPAESDSVWSFCRLVVGSLPTVATWSPLQAMPNHSRSDVLIPVNPTEPQPGIYFPLRNICIQYFCFSAVQWNLSRSGTSCVGFISHTLFHSTFPFTKKFLAIEMCGLCEQHAQACT